jgi:small-conductance mechanosensitive channel
MNVKWIFLVLIASSAAVQGHGQGRGQVPHGEADSLPGDTAHAAEKLILQQQEQLTIDSAIRAQFQAELQQAAGDVGKTRQLQAQLREIGVKDSLKKAEQLARIEALKKHAKGYPVVLNADTLFKLYTRVGSFGADERAMVISRRIRDLYDNIAFKPDSLRVTTTENGFDIVYKGDLIVMSVSQLDALWYNMTMDSLADSYRTVIIREIVREQKANSFKSWARRIGLAAGILLALLLVIYGINKAFRRLRVVLRSNRERYAQGFTFRKYRILSPEKLEQFALRFNNLVRIVLVVLALYFTLLLLSGIFTATEKWSDTLLSWILTPARSALHSFIRFLPNLFTIIVLYLIFRYAIRGLRYLSGEVGKGNIVLSGFHQEWAHPTYNIIKFLLYAFMLILVFPYLPGSASPAFRGVSVFLGVLISLGSSSAINNMVAGLVITYMRPFKVGDRVKIGEVTGDVLEKNMLVTRIRTIKNEDITVPNSTVLSGSTVNYSSNTKPEDTGLILHTTVTIGYDTPWKDMHQALLVAAGRTMWVEKSPEPFVLQTGLDDFFVSYQLNVYTKEANRQATIYSELHQQIQDACNEAGIEILSPHYTSVRDGNSTSIPEDYRAKDYEAPPFVFRANREGKE